MDRLLTALGSNDAGILGISKFPNEGTVRLSVPRTTYDPLTLVDMLGRVVLSKPLELRAGLNEVIVELPVLAAGSYLLRLGGEVVKLVIDR